MNYAKKISSAMLPVRKYYNGTSKSMSENSISGCLTEKLNLSAGRMKRTSKIYGVRAVAKTIVL